MHMALVNRLIDDASLPAASRTLLRSAWGAFLLGSVAPDARVSSGISRVDTHFFEYTPSIDPPPVSAMLTRHPGLRHSAPNDEKEAARVAFVAGYAGHLAMDEIWCVDMLFPHFIHGHEWNGHSDAMLTLHVLLSHLDERDLQQLPAGEHYYLMSAEPCRWLPFMPDEALRGWRDIIAAQLPPAGASRTLEILGKRVGLSVEEMAGYVTSKARMDEIVWSTIPAERLAAAEEAMYVAVRRTVIAYLDDSI
jgi:hypothetical protein